MRRPQPEPRAHADDGGDVRPLQTASDDPRFALLVARLSARLRPVCTGWDDAEFEALVHQIARMKVRWGEAYRSDAFRAD